MLPLVTGIPGSHKTNWTLPQRFRNLDKYIDENVRPIPAKAGDCIIVSRDPDMRIVWSDDGCSASCLMSALTGIILTRA